MNKNFVNEKWLFPKDIKEAFAAQEQMAQKVCLQDDFKTPITHLAGVDISNTPFDPEQMIYAAIVILSYPSLEVVEIKTASMKQKFPYIPGLLGFREVPVLVEAYQGLKIKPDVIMVDGHGVSHPRGLGVASHLGVLLDIPTVGVAKSILVGRPSGSLPEKVGSRISLIWKSKETANMVRTKKNCSPLIISAGHRIGLKTAVDLIFNCLKGYRLPEPTRYAHLYANDCRIKNK